MKIAVTFKWPWRPEDFWHGSTEHINHPFTTVQHGAQKGHNAHTHHALAIRQPIKQDESKKYPLPPNSWAMLSGFETNFYPVIGNLYSNVYQIWEVYVKI